MKQIVKLIVIPVLFIWLGLILGISFLEAPLKFQAPHITLELGLGIGRLVFSALNKMEILFSVIILIPSIYLFKNEKPTASFVFLLVAIVIIQTAYLLPQLDIRANAVINHQFIAPSYLHVFYVGFELLKVILLGATGVLLLKSKNHEARY